MADTSKAQKLASARKKFKELKKEKQKNTTAPQKGDGDSARTSREETPVENELTTNVNDEQQHTHLPNYFSTNDNQAAFFDTFYQNSASDNSNKIPEKELEAPAIAFTTPSLDSYFTNGTVSPQNFQTTPEPSRELHAGTGDVKVDNTTSPEAESSQPQYVIQSLESLRLLGNNQFGENHGESSQPQYLISSAESLRQLSSQMAQLAEPNSDFIPPNTELELELRNQELASQLNRERVRTDQLNALVLEYQQKNAQLENELKDKEIGNDNRFEQEIGRLKEELQYHVQTLGILVAEKAELSANLSQLQMTSNQKTTECEELQARLKASRSRVADLEREIGILRNEKSQFDSAGRERTGEFEKLSEGYRTLKDEKDELMQDLLEAREKLKNSSANNLAFQQQISELSSQLSLANIKIQQLTTGGQDQVSGQVEQLTHEKFALEKQLSDLNVQIKTLTKEREEANLHYQQYAQQLNGQLGNLAEKLEHLQKENETLSLQEQNRVRHIGELEKQLQNLQSTHVTFATQRNNGEVKAELEASLGLIEKLKAENARLQEQSLEAAGEKDVLLKDVASKTETIGRLEDLLEQIRGNQPDNGKLLAIMESDKVAAARAVAQNAELKQQMDSMQEVFMKLNNDKVELTEKLTIEQRGSKDLIEKLQKTELHLQTLADAIEIKDKELSHLRESSLELSKQVIQGEQLSDRLRHYEAQDHSSHSVQSELQEAQNAIAQLKDEVAKLQSTSGDVENLRNQLAHLEFANRNLESQLKMTNGEGMVKSDDTTDNNSDTNQNVLDKESAMRHLEQKFLKTMEDIAVLTEEKQRLEHLVLQLQSETETIGEYVALYQQQRSVLKQKALEKDQQLTQLASDRELIKNKLEKLNDLVRKLVLEKGAVTTELLQHHESLNRESHELCAEHARIHDEINKITENSLSRTAEGGGGAEESDSHDNETAEQIIALLSEIKTSNLVQPAEKLHHCPWCSGQLITV